MQSFQQIWLYNCTSSPQINMDIKQCSKAMTLFCFFFYSKIGQPTATTWLVPSDQQDTVRDASSRVTECESHVMLNGYPDILNGQWRVSICLNQRFGALLLYPHASLIIMQWYVLKRQVLSGSGDHLALIHWCISLLLAVGPVLLQGVGCLQLTSGTWKGSFCSSVKKDESKGPGSGWIPPFFLHMAPRTSYLNGGSEMGWYHNRKQFSCPLFKSTPSKSAKKAKPIHFFSLPRPWTHSLCREMTLMQECSGPAALWFVGGSQRENVPIVEGDLLIA